MAALVDGTGGPCRRRRGPQWACAAPGSGADRRAGEWRAYGADLSNNKYAPFEQITAANVQNLRIAWRHPALDPELKTAFPKLTVTNYYRATPVMLDGTLFVQNGVGLAQALDARTGKVIWVQEALTRGLEGIERRQGQPWPRHLARWPGQADSDRERRLPVRPRREDGQGIPGVWGQRKSRFAPGPDPADDPVPVGGRAARRQGRRGHRRARPGLPHSHGRYAGRRSRVRRSHGNAALDVPRDSAFGRVRREHLGRRFLVWDYDLPAAPILANTPQGGGGTKFRAYDKATGAVRWETDLPAGTTGAPMTYRVDGRQFIVVAIGSAEHDAELVAFSLQ